LPLTSTKDFSTSDTQGFVWKEWLSQEERKVVAECK
jgi:hypothetical protein